MFLHLMQRMSRLGALGLLVGLSTGAAAVATAQSVSGGAFGAYVNTAQASQSRSPLAVLPAVAAPNGDMAEASAASLAVPGALTADLLTAVTSGSVGDDRRTSAQSVATAANVNILNGLITATRVIGVVSSIGDGFRAASDANGSTFQNLVVNGVLVAADGPVAENTRVNLPGVGYVLLNEQIRSGQGNHSSQLTVNMIRVVLQDADTGAQTGEIIVGSASSGVAKQ